MSATVNNDAGKWSFLGSGLHLRVMEFTWSHSGQFSTWFSALILLGILFPFSFRDENLVLYLPALSQAGTALICGGVVNVAKFLTALAGCLTMSVRYVNVVLLNESANKVVNSLNNLSLSCGAVCLSSLILLASFPRECASPPLELCEDNKLFVHMLATGVVFVFGSVYMLMHALITFFYYEKEEFMCWVRIGLCFACSVLYVTCTLSTIAFPSPIVCVGVNADVFVELINAPNFVASVSEWLLIFISALYFMTFGKEAEELSTAVTFQQATSGTGIHFDALNTDDI